MPQRLRVRQNPASSFVGGIIAIVCVIIGLTVVIPQAGAFGVVWTLFAVVGAAISFYNAFSDQGIVGHVIDVPDELPKANLPPADPETRLRQLETLRVKGLLTPVEYQARRSKILDEL